MINKYLSYREGEGDKTLLLLGAWLGDEMRNEERKCVPLQADARPSLQYVLQMSLLFHDPLQTVQFEGYLEICWDILGFKKNRWLRVLVVSTPSHRAEEMLIQ